MAFAVEHEKFQGPLDFLLQEIEREKLSINEVSLGRITDHFLAYLKSLPASAQHEIAEFIVVASQLLLIKSRSLLPSLELTQEEEVSIEELESRLKLLQKIRERAKELEELLQKNHMLFAREGMQGMEVVFYPPPKLSPDDLAETFREVLAAIPKPKALEKDEIKKVISLEEKIIELQDSLRTRVERLFSDIIKTSHDKTEIIVNFLAILELAKQKIVDLHQEDRFGEIRIRSYGEGKTEEENNGNE